MIEQPHKIFSNNYIDGENPFTFGELIVHREWECAVLQVVGVDGDYLLLQRYKDQNTTYKYWSVYGVFRRCGKFDMKRLGVE